MEHGNDVRVGKTGTGFYVVRLVVAVSLVLVLAVGILYLTDDPRVVNLLTSSLTSSESDEDPLAFLEDLPEVTPKAESAPVQRKSRRPRYSAAPPPEYHEPASSEPANSVSNAETLRVLTQVLRARGFDGVSLEVTDAQIIVSGTVESTADRRQILALLERGRENRSLDTSGLTGGE